MNYKKMVRSIIFIFFLTIVFTSSTLAHVVVRPAEVGKAAFQTFTVGVPNEKDSATVGLRVVMPGGVKHVTPNVKAGWTIETKKEGEGEEAIITEISWSGGSIPAGQRDEFLFSSQVPAEESTLVWKAYQTHEDGTIVSWDQEEDTGHGEGSSENGPASKTTIINDLNTGTVFDPSEGSSDARNNTSYLSIGAIVMAAVALGLQLYKKS